MNSSSLVNNILDKLAHYISRITAFQCAMRRSLPINEYYVN